MCASRAWPPLLVLRSGFAAVANRLIVGPILKTLVFSTTPSLTREWVDSICSDWSFRQIIPAHFTAPIPGAPLPAPCTLGARAREGGLSLRAPPQPRPARAATPADFKAAFAFVYEPTPPPAAAAAATMELKSSQPTANPAAVLDGLLLSLLGRKERSPKAAEPAAGGKRGAQYPEEDIKALNSARRFLERAGVVNKPS